LSAMHSLGKRTSSVQLRVRAPNLFIKQINEPTYLRAIHGICRGSAGR